MRLALLILVFMSASVRSQPFTLADPTVYVAVTNVTGALYAWWKFDEGSGITAADSSGNGFTLTTNNAVTSWNSPGKIGASSAYVNNAANAGFFSVRGFPSTGLVISNSTKSGTITWWEYNLTVYNAAVDRESWVQQINGTPTWYLMFDRYSNGNVYMGWGNASVDRRLSFAMTAAMFPQNTWMFYSFSWNAEARAVFYTNGVIAKTGTTDPSTMITNLSGTSFVVGGSPATGATSANSYIDDFRIYTNYITSNQVNYLYHKWYGQP